MSNKPRFQRDVFIEVLIEEAKKDKDIVFISADLGAPALDIYREELPEQFIHSGISEQHLIDMAAGLALSGKKVYAYAMAPFLSLRCYEQIKCSLAMMDLPVAVLGVGVGLGYADSGPTHYLTEDLACMRALPGIEVLTATDAHTSRSIADLTVRDPKFRYIRLDRDPMPDVTDAAGYDEDFEKGFKRLKEGSDVCLISSGYTMHRTLEAQRKLAAEGIDASVVDLFRIKPIDFMQLGPILEAHRGIVTIEEQCLDGGFGSAVIEQMVNVNLVKPVKRVGLEERFYFENGGRDYLLDRFGVSVDSICNAAKEVLG
jgi:transketolase